jgi:hypothetical protein
VLRQLDVLSGSAQGRLRSKCFKLYQTTNSCNHINNIGLELDKAMRNRYCFILGTITEEIQICWFNDYLLYTFNQRFLSMWSLLHSYKIQRLLPFSHFLFIICIPTLDVFRPDVLPLSLSLNQPETPLIHEQVKPTPLLILSQILSVTLSYALFSHQPLVPSVSIPKCMNVHLESERRCEHNTEEDVVPSEQKAI